VVARERARIRRLAGELAEQALREREHAFGADEGAAQATHAGGV
jgi:hypothetical protein